MGKLDELLRGVGGNVGESMGAGREPGVSRRATVAPGAGMPERLRGVAKSKAAMEIPVDRIVRDPAQPREEFDPEALDRLAASLKGRGQLQPVRVWWDEGQGAYVLVAGERRWRAARLAGLATLACVVRDTAPSPGDRLVDQMVENCVREDLAPLEQARAFRSLMETNGWSARQVARELSIDHNQVSRALALLRLPDDVQEQVERGTIAPATAHEIGKAGDPETIRAVAAEVAQAGLSRAEAVERVRQAAAPRGKGRGGRPAASRSRVIRVAAGRVTVDLRRAGDAAVVLAALREAVAALEAEQGGAAEAA